MVDAIDLGRDSDGFRFLLLSAAYFVYEIDLFEPGYRDVGDVLNDPRGQPTTRGISLIAPSVKETHINCPIAM